MSDNLEYRVSPITKYRAGTENDPHVLLSQSQKVINQRLQLSEIPAYKNKVVISGYLEVGEDYEEDLGSNEYRVDYREGIIHFSPSAEGKTLTVVYYGRGTHYISAERVWVEENNGEVVKTLKDLTDELEEVIEEGEEFIERAEEALEELTETMEEFDKSEEERRANETARVTAESARVTAENARVTAEKARVTAESSRVTAESARVTAENARASAEATRISNEAARVSAENARASAETARVSAESARVTAESKRVTAESARVTAENARVSAESARVIAENAREEAIDNLVHLGEYSSSITYEKNNMVLFNGSTYVCTADSSTGNSPTNESYWSLVASKGLDGSIEGIGATVTELGYLNGVTSNIQTQLDSKQATITGGASTITTSNLTTSRALVSDSSGKVAVSAVTSTELGYLDGATSNIQDQIDKTVKYLSLSWDYTLGVIPLCCLDNTSISANYYFGGELFFYRNNGLNGNYSVTVQVQVQKIYNTDSPVYSLNRVGSSFPEIFPVTFLYGGMKYFGIRTQSTGAHFSKVIVRGTASDWSIIEPISVYNSNTDTISNSEIYDSLTFLETENDTNSKETCFHKLPTYKPIDSDGNSTSYDFLHSGNALGKLGITATATELNYVDGVTSNIQEQLDGKLSLTDGTVTGNLIVNGLLQSDKTIGDNEGDSVVMSQDVARATSNNIRLLTQAVRLAAGTDWREVAIELRRITDSTNQAALRFYQNEVQFWDATNSEWTGLSDLKQSVSNGKALLAAVIGNILSTASFDQFEARLVADKTNFITRLNTKSVDVSSLDAETTPLATLVDRIGDIQTGKYGTATAAQVLTGYTVGTEDGLVTGTIPILTGMRYAQGTAQWSDGGLAVYPEKGYQKGGSGDGEIKVLVSQLQSAESDLVSSNIKSGTSIFGITGTLEPANAAIASTTFSDTNVNTSVTATIPDLDFTPTIAVVSGVYINTVAGGVGSSRSSGTTNTFTTRSSSSIKSDGSTYSVTLSISGNTLTLSSGIRFSMSSATYNVLYMK